MKKVFPVRAASKTSAAAETRKSTVRLALSRALFCLLLCLFARTVNAQDKTMWVPVDFHEEIKSRLEAELSLPIEYLVVSVDEYRSESFFACDIFKYKEIVPLPESEKDNFFISLPYAWDFAVIISRKDDGDMLDSNANLEEKKYITISGNSSPDKYLITKKQKLSYNITTDTNPFNSFSKIFKGEADFTILPSRIADDLLIMTSMKNELYVSGTPENSLLKFGYRFAVKKSDGEAFIKLNDAISKMYKNGTLVEIARKNSLSPIFIPNYDETPAPTLRTVIKTLNVIVLSSTLIIFLLSLILIRKTQKKKKETPQEVQTAALETLELKRQVDEYLMGQVTLTEQTLKDPYSGLFRMSYFKDRIDEEISRQNNLGQVFSVVLLRFKDISAITMKLLKDAADMVQEDFNKDCICCYDGNGTFEVLLPKHTQDDIQIFAESAAEHLERITHCEFDTEVIQYGTIKHSEFMEKVCKQ